MATTLLYLILSGTVIFTLFRSWVGVVAYYTVSLGYPQLIWFWAFESVRVVFTVAATVILVFVKDLFLGRLDFSVLKQKQNAYMVILWASLVVSYFFGAYGVNTVDNLNQNSAYILSYFSNVFLFYFISMVLIDSHKKFHALVTVFIIVVLYYTYWAHQQYFTYGFPDGQRLPGPGPLTGGIGGGPYSDENAFAMLFVMGTPFLYFLGNYSKQKVIRYGLWLSIPFAWHGVYLTGSMGGLIGLGVTVMVIAVRSRKRSLLVLIPVLFLLTFLWQGGEYLRDKTATAGGGVTEVYSAQTRFESWEAGMLMVINHPLTGVGLGNFLQAYPAFSIGRPFVAHNTFLQFGAESGMIAGLMYLLLIWNIVVIQLRMLRMETLHPLHAAVGEAVVACVIGFFVCSMFLNLAQYEVLYYMFLLSALQQRLVTSGTNNNELPVARKGLRR